MVFVHIENFSVGLGHSLLFAIDEQFVDLASRFVDLNFDFLFLNLQVHVLLHPEISARVLSDRVVRSSIDETSDIEFVRSFVTNVPVETCFGRSHRLNHQSSLQ